MQELPATDRVCCFREVELGLRAEDALAEASRCFQCDVRD